jgi:hypothetical protein
MVFEGIKGVEDVVVEVLLAQVIPDVLDRI